MFDIGRVFRLTDLLWVYKVMPVAVWHCSSAWHWSERAWASAHANLSIHLIHWVSVFWDRDSMSHTIPRGLTGAPGRVAVETLARSHTRWQTGHAMRGHNFMPFFSNPKSSWVDAAASHSAILTGALLSHKPPSPPAPGGDLSARDMVLAFVTLYSLPFLPWLPASTSLPFDVGV